MAIVFKCIGRTLFANFCNFCSSVATLAIREIAHPQFVALKIRSFYLELAQMTPISDNTSETMDGITYHSESWRPSHSVNSIGSVTLRQDSLDIPSSHSDGAQRLILSVDFGTTYSSVSYLLLANEGSNNDVEPLLRRIKTINNYPGDPGPRITGFVSDVVPTEMWFANQSTREEPSQTINSDPAYPNDYEEGSVPDSTSTNILWGYQPSERMRDSACLPSEAKAIEEQRLKLFKLLLDESEHTKSLREEVEARMTIVGRKFQNEQDKVGIIAKYLTCLFRHTRDQLLKERIDVQALNLLEIIICIPPSWSTRARRIMSLAVKQAMEKSRLTTADESRTMQAFFKEPEAAATWMIHDPNVATQIKVCEVQSSKLQLTSVAWRYNARSRCWRRNG